jgi:pantoate--beta-alanine ligase
MEIVTTLADARRMRARHGRVALVPTMGALHAGHMSLVAHARNNAPTVAVSIFVNPTQFGPKEDYTKYPRPIEEDLDKCAAAGVDFIFAPTAAEMYPPDTPDIVVDLPSLTGVLEGKHRPGHFKGVCQVVAKLFNILQPTAACFGQKDFQQLRVISAMVEALDMPIDVISCPTLRDPDGLAMSSRNIYLSPEERQRALAISRSLMLAYAEFRSGINQTNRLIATMQRPLLEMHLNIDYVAAVDADSLKPVEKADAPTLLAIAARVGNTRLIDNVVIAPPESLPQHDDDDEVIEGGAD